MTEDNNQDMAMEDILSSIKNILEEDEANRQAMSATAEPEEAASVVDVALSAEDDDMDVDDILDLSADMQVVEEPISVSAVPEIDLDNELDDVAVTELAEPDYEVAGVEDAAPVEPAPAYEQTPIAEPTPTPISEAATPEASDAVDVSANIISNFTKMFSRPEPKPAEPVQPAPEPIKLVGDGCKTIEDVICDVIRRIIGEEVEQNWRAEADYDKFAREVIVTLARTWLDNNLPTIVETIVKQEIERVMAKVGSNQ